MNDSTDAKRKLAESRSTKVVTRSDDVLRGLREFVRATANPDKSFRPGVDPEYRGMSDSAYSDVAGTVSPDSPEGRTYDTTLGLAALHALGFAPPPVPLPTSEAILKSDYQQFPAYSTSLFPWAYLCAGRPIPEQADRGIRTLMEQDATGPTLERIPNTGEIVSLDLAPDGKSLVVGGADRIVRSWRTQ